MAYVACSWHIGTIWHEQSSGLAMTQACTYLGKVRLPANVVVGWQHHLLEPDVPSFLQDHETGFTEANLSRVCMVCISCGGPDDLQEGMKHKTHLRATTGGEEVSK